MLKLTPLILLLALASAHQGHAAQEEEAATVPVRRWVSFAPEGHHNGPVIFHANGDTHPDVRRRQGSASITTPATAGSAAASSETGAYEEPPSLPPVRSDLIESLSSLDSSLDAEVNSVISQMTTAECVGVPDINGKPVTLCGPPAPSAPREVTSSTDNAAARGGMVAGGLVVGLAGALVL